MKTIYTAKGLLFESRDLCVVACNVKNPVELNVPDSVEVITGEIKIDPLTTGNKETVFLIPELNGVELDYCYDYEFRFDACNFYGNDEVNYGFKDLTDGLQERINDYINETLREEIIGTDEFPWEDNY